MRAYAGLFLLFVAASPTIVLADSFTYRGVTVGNPPPHRVSRNAITVQTQPPLPATVPADPSRKAVPSTTKDTGIQPAQPKTPATDKPATDESATPEDTPQPEPTDPAIGKVGGIGKVGNPYDGR